MLNKSKLKKLFAIVSILSMLTVNSLSLVSYTFAQSNDITPSPEPTSVSVLATPTAPLTSTPLPSPTGLSTNTSSQPSPAPNTATHTPTPSEESIFSGPPPTTPFTGPTAFPTRSPSIAPTLTLPPVSMPSANLKKPFILRPTSKKYYSAKESIVAVVLNAKDYEIDTELVHDSGDKVDVLIEKESNVDFATLRIPPSLSFKPGGYTLKVKDKTGNSDSIGFTWGNLALNTNKSFYQPGEKALTYLSVTDNSGRLVCQAKIRLELKKEDMALSSFSTEDGTIKNNPDCANSNENYRSDYQAEIILPQEQGTFNLFATAQIDKNTYQSEEIILVYSSPLSIERKAATRFHPLDWQKMEITLSAQEDFSGTVTDTIPDVLDIASPDQSTIKPYDRVTADSTWYNRGSILGTFIPPLRIPFDTPQYQTLGFGDNLVDPLLKRMYSQFGLAGHDGIDFNLSIGTPILAADDGMIALAGPADYGNTVVIQHDWGKSYYGHLSTINVTLGQKVSKGQEMALSGNTGLSTGAHLHFGIKPDKNDRYNGYYGKINPLPYLQLPENQVSYMVSPATYTATSLSGVKKISWDISLKKGESITLGYRFKTPPDPSTAYLLGPISYSTKPEARNPNLETNSSNLGFRISDFSQSSSSLFQIIAEYYEIPGASFDGTPEELPMLTIDPILLNVPEDYTPQNAALSEDLIGKYSTLNIKKSLPQFTMSIASSSGIINWLRLSLDNHNPAAFPGITQGNKIEWPAVQPSVDLLYETYDGYLNQKLIIRDDSAEKTFIYKLEKGDNLTVEDYFGHILVKDSQTEEEFFLLRFPQGIDAQNQRIDYKYKLEGDTITLYPARFWQYQKAVYPITIYAPVNVIAWTETLVQVGENCESYACGKDGDIWSVKPSGWHWGKEERKKEAIVKIPKFTEDERLEYESTTLSWQDIDFDSDYVTVKAKLQEKQKEVFSDYSGLVRYGLDYTLLVNPHQLSVLRDKKKSSYSPFIDAKKNPSVIRKKNKPLSSVIPDNRRLAYKPERKSLLAKLFEKLLPGVSAQAINTYTIGSASRNYTSISSWESARQGTLTADNRREIGAMYNDSTFTGVTNTSIAGSTTDSTRYMHLTAPAGERHNGTAGTGVTVTGSSSGTTCIVIKDDYTIIEWLDINQCGTAANNNGQIDLADDDDSSMSDGVVIQNIIIHNYRDTVNTDMGIRSAMNVGGTASIRNCIIYDGDDTRSGIQGNASNTNGQTVTIENCTVWGSVSGGGTPMNVGYRENSDSCVAPADSTFNIYNSIAMNTDGTIGDFNVDCGTLTNVMCEDNVSDCNRGTVTTCTNCLYNQSTSGQFVSTTAGSEDFHLVSTSTAIDKGTDLSANFLTDIDDTIRSSGPWDIGADEYPRRLIDALMRHGKYFNSSGKQPFTF